MKQSLRRFQKKLRAVVQILRAKQVVATFPMAPDNEARAIICAILRPYFQVRNAELENSLYAIADKILAKFKVPLEKNSEEQLEGLLDETLNQAFWYHGQLAALTATWEFRVRILANKFGIRPNVPIKNKSRKNRANASVEHRTLKTTIKELNKACGDRLNLKLLELCDLRDSIVHCNPHGMRAYATQLFGKDALKPLRGNVVAFSLSAVDAKNLSDIKDEEEAENQDFIGWFLEVFNSGLPKKAFATFSDSINKLDTLILFHAISFDERTNIFDKVIFRGQQPTREDIAKFRNYFDSQYHPKINADAFFQKISSFVRTDIRAR